MATITTNLNITWTEAHQLTVAEVNDLLDMIREDHRRQEEAHRRAARG